MKRSGRLRRSPFPSVRWPAKTEPKPKGSAPQLKCSVLADARRRERRLQIQRLTDLSRKIVLLRDGNRCRRCHNAQRPGRLGALQAAHIFPKGKFPGMQFDMDNILTLCGRCHLFWWHKNPIEAMNWIVETMGRDFLDGLQLRVRTRRMRADRKALELYLKRKLQQMIDERGKTRHEDD